MRATIGVTRAGKLIEIEMSPPAVLLPVSATQADVFDTLCAVTYLYVRERHGWRLVVDVYRIFRDVLEEIELDPVFRTALADSRREEPARTFADDILAGRDLVLPALRA